MPQFKRIYVEITNCCNLRCDFCPTMALKRQERLMSEGDFQHILNQVQPYTKHLYFHLLGEPLLHPNLGLFFQKSAEADMQINLTTNGMLIEKVQHVLIDAKALRQINFSIHAFEANENEEDIRQYLTTLTKFIDELHKQRQVYISLRLWNMDTKELQAKNTLNQRILSHLEEAFQLDYALSERLQERKQLKIRDLVYLHMDEKFAWPTLERDIIREDVFCYGLRDHLGILADGTVVPCCLDSEGQIPLGNVFKKPLSVILKSDRARAIYDGFSQRKAVEPLCKRCGYAAKKS